MDGAPDLKEANEGEQASGASLSQGNFSGTGQSGSNTKDGDKATGNLIGAQVRWFYKESIGNAQWTPFGGFDTLIAEDAYRKLPPDLKVPQKYILKSENTEQNTEPKVEVEYASTSLKVQVLGGLYELDLLRRKISSVYWPGEVMECTRGTWFFYGSWQPLDEVTADFIEKEHLTVFKGKTLSDFSSAPITPIHSQTFTDFNVDWYSPTEVYFYSNRTPSQLMKTFTRKIGYFQKSAGTRIIRAFKTLATESDRRKDISHMVFVVHGVGQLMNMKIGDHVFGNTCLIRERVTAMKEEYFPESSQYVEFFPVEWRSKVVLDDGLVDCITPPNIRYLRDFINTSAMDIMYYMSPVYCKEIQDCVTNEMNRLYDMFIQRNPNLNPKVSVVAHSLGAVIVYDIVTGYLPQGFIGSDALEPGKSRLGFALDNFFCIGSPLSVFLAMRAKKGNHGSNLFPTSMCNRLYNIYHLTDPIAYRLEPLVHEDYCIIAPIPIQQYDCAKPKRYCEMPVVLEGADDSTSASHAVGLASTEGPKSLDGAAGREFTAKDVSRKSPSEDFKTTVAAAIPGTSSNFTESLPTSTPTNSAWKDKGRNIWHTLWKKPMNKEHRSSSRVVDPPIQALDHRLDYVLTSGATGALFIKSILVSHMAYWSDNDVALFVLTRIFPELEDELCSEEGHLPRKNRKRKHCHNASESTKKDVLPCLSQID